MLNTAQSSNIFYGRVKEVNEIEAKTEKDGQPAEEEEEAEPYEWTVTVDCGGANTIEVRTLDEVEPGDFVRVVMEDDWYARIQLLSKLRNVPVTNWIGAGAVTMNGRNYLVPNDVPVYNRDTGMWMNGEMELALRYARSTNLYIQDGTVKVVEVFG